MKKLILDVSIVALALVANIKGEPGSDKALKTGDTECDKLGVLVYEDLGCKPEIGKPGDLCPASYDCRHFHDFGVHCYFKGVKYEVGQQIPANISTLSCNVGCFCNPEGSFTCATLDCPEWLGVPPKAPDCIRTYDLNKCCSTGELCPPFDNVATCEVDGEIYKEGTKFYPKNSCSVCVCHKGFAGKYEAPYCRKTACAVELKHRSDLEQHCAPVYDDKEYLCCPFFWTCLSEDDVINPTDKPQASNDSCIFGNKNVKLGETLQKTVDRYGKQYAVRCECKLPPLLTCIIEKSVFLKIN